MSPPSSPEEEAPSSPEEQAPSSPEEQERPPSPVVATREALKMSDEHPLSRPMLPLATTPEVPKASNPTQVEAKEVQLSDIAPIMLDDTDVKTKIDDIAELDIAEDFDNRPSKKAKISESRVLEPSPMSPTMKTSSPGSECFESFVPESDN
ncbi:uncharacterized protein [Aegilops tauschii subsp. strangulata]|uniref:uncharacterized protein isoform X2 n=1 Tax=Aegilops tauschii subsp. strangulata TaxID=200361 RepID=UPI00098A0352